MQFFTQLLAVYRSTIMALHHKELPGLGRIPAVCVPRLTPSPVSCCHMNLAWCGATIGAMALLCYMGHPKS